MRLLLDSHAFFWALTDDSRLSHVASDFILGAENVVFFSPVSLYELVFKARRGRMPEAALRLPEAARAAGFEEMGLTSAHLLHAANLDWDHGDPWDRILLAQASLEDTHLVSADTVFDARTERRVW